jgi:hypothetical protein
MIILTQKYGQLGNRLAYLRVYLSFALEHNVKILNLAFDEYEKYFAGTSECMITFPRIISVLVRKLFIWFIRCGVACKMLFRMQTLQAGSKGIVDLNDVRAVQACSHHNVIINDGWPVVGLSVLNKHDGQIRAFFTPVNTIVEKVQQFLEQVRHDCDVLIGIHIRQGDYKVWDNGRHFFNTGEYVGIMFRLIEIHKDRRVRFVVCSNEEQNWDLFTGCDYRKTPGNAVEDMYILAGCDEIYGPQSSFSAWASFFGSVPLCWIKTPEDFEKAVKVME